MTNLEYNVVLSFCKILLYLKFSVTNFVVLDSDTGTYEDSGVAAVCCRHNFQQLLRQKDRHTLSLHTACVCDTTLIRLATLTNATFSSNTYSCVRRGNICPFISLLPISNDIPDTYQINTSPIQPMLNFNYS